VKEKVAHSHGAKEHARPEVGLVTPRLSSPRVCVQSSGLLCTRWTVQITSRTSLIEFRRPPATDFMISLSYCVRAGGSRVTPRLTGTASSDEPEQCSLSVDTGLHSLS
jgi:hypothetical protein